ncbi:MULTISPECIES: enoyl-CoA hydratase-related protein [Rhodopseudomonas]|uniref:Enoyl-CoA hydratase n=1 Tax=Rhodopseudomonas palustris TaxID=1076 RepID=A0A0D7F2N8_RHOPL|nr:MULTISPECIES: enoyl-CoA hydratase-related protein [Rhodopseudomonas]KIZ47299.1 enoyl-CoA hydratase [Rhodopseudomonas palustris]MDF3813452.1 enoyl-CoA hydratase-related protein [Rhodopseudomonas sp. BAL398]WOK15663.1 enoyl-CoA hydratase-related protein [Rhodopseudomonas sp. BAL398]
MSMVLHEQRGAVAILTLNNPEQYNALGGSLLVDLGAALDAALADPSVRAIMLTGAGKGFCAGAQLGGATFDMGDQVAQMMRGRLNPLLEKMRAAPKPIVVAVNGAAAGAGVGIALAGDIVIAARSARFILSFVRLGAALDAGTSLFLQRSIGVARARALALTGEALSADKAEQWGLIWKTVDDAELRDAALATAQRLAEGPPLSIGLIKTQIESAWAASLSSTLDDEAESQARAFVTEDLREGAAAFVQKRPARFAGR